MTDWTQKKCMPCEGKTAPMPESAVRTNLKDIPAWSFEYGVITRSYEFQNYYETGAFVNAAAWIAHREDHHPEISFGYKKCTVSYSTHAVKGISDNDFICAAQTDRLLK